jgi:hypothetical protein
MLASGVGSKKQAASLKPQTLLKNKGAEARTLPFKNKPYATKVRLLRWSGLWIRRVQSKNALRRHVHGESEVFRLARGSITPTTFGSTQHRNVLMEIETMKRQCIDETCQELGKYWRV